ncbi:MAG: formate dehydrogenase subunit gamma [Reyranella sp.]|uniref:formate dehydrogenase subunit gamma n=1 Tax=Reyranella sp. TaxID=1929291 RepID=UPI003D0C923A
MPARAAWDELEAKGIIDLHKGREGALLPILHDLQAVFGCVPPAAIRLVADALNLSRAEVHGVVSFYHDFREQPGGRHVLKLCRAEACQSMGGEALARQALDRLGLDWGDTTADGRLTVEAVYCLGLCASAPAALLDGEPLARLTPRSLDEIATGVGN